MKVKEKEEKRNAARLLMQWSRIDIDDRIEVVSKQQQQNKRQEVSGEFTIGANEDEVHAMKKEEKKKYFALLSSDLNAPLGMRNQGVQGPGSPKFLTGLLIGGHCMDSSKSTQTLNIKEKKAKQQDYNTALHDQQTFNAKIREEKEFVANLNFDATSVPYMRI